MTLKRYSFLDYYELCDRAQSIDVCVSLISEYANKNELSADERLTLSFFYATCYVGLTGIALYRDWKDGSLSPNRLGAYWKENKPRLLFHADRARVRNADQWPECAKSWFTSYGSRPIIHLGAFRMARAGGYAAARAAVESSVKYFGLFSVYNFLQAAQRLLPDLSIEPPRIEVEEKRTCYAAVAADIGVPMSAATAVDAHARRLLSEIRGSSLQRRSAYDVETILCEFNARLSAREYLGYSWDKTGLQIVKTLAMDARRQSAAAVEFCLRYRAERLPDYARIEINAANAASPSRSANREALFLKLLEGGA